MLVLPTFIPSVIAAITKVASTLGPMVAKYAPIVMKTIGGNLPTVLKTIESISLASDVLKTNDRAEDLGAKAISAEKKPEDFEQINDYINYLRSDVEVNESTLSTDPVDVAVRQSVGAAIVIKALGNELGADISLPFLNKISELGVESNVVLEIIKSYEKSGVNTGDVEAYIESELTLDEAKQHSECLLYAYQSAHPLMTSEEVEQAVMKDF